VANFETDLKVLRIFRIYERYFDDLDNVPVRVASFFSSLLKQNPCQILGLVNRWIFVFETFKIFLRTRTIFEILTHDLNNCWYPIIPAKNERRSREIHKVLFFYHF